MTHTTKIYGLIMASALVVAGLMISVIHSPEPVHAQTCSAGSSVGNLLGYATMSNFPNTNSANRIYMSTESWNNEESAPTSQQFAVSYNRQTGIWSGRGWSPEMGWVDFGKNYPSRAANKEAVFQDVEQRPDEWGNWEETIDLSEVVYNTDSYQDEDGRNWNPGLQNYGTNAEHTTNITSVNDDDDVGAGLIDFSGVQLVESCAEYVNVTLNNANRINQDSCPINAAIIRWTTTNVVPGSCETAGGIWQSGDTGNQSDNNTGNTIRAENITASNPEGFVRLQCIGVGSGATISGVAHAECGSPDVVDCPPGRTCDITGQVIPEFREV